MLEREDSAPGSHAAKVPTTEREKKGSLGSFSFHYFIRSWSYSGKFELTEFGWGPASLTVGQSAVA